MSRKSAPAYFFHRVTHAVVSVVRLFGLGAARHPFWGVCMFQRVLVLFLALAGPVAAQTGGCKEPDLAAETPVGTLRLSPEDQVSEEWYFFEDPCDGALYIADSGGANADRINESWRLWSFIGAKYPDSLDLIHVTAEFVTGIGPTGAEPFRVTIPLARGAKGWVAGEATVIE